MQRGSGESDDGAMGMRLDGDKWPGGWDVTGYKSNDVRNRLMARNVDEVDDNEHETCRMGCVGLGATKL